MTQAQKIIKYLATCFACFLIVTIISAILGGIYGLVNSLGLVKSNESVITADLKVISNGEEDVDTLELELSLTNLKIKTGDNFKVETNNSKITFTENNGVVKIKEKNHNWSLNNNYASDLIIYIPKNMITLDEVNIESGAGKILIENLNTQELNLELGAGETKINNLNVTKTCDIDSGAGKVSILSGIVRNLDFDMGVGETNLTASLTGKSDIDAGVGNVNLTLLGNKENYQIKIDKGLGNVSLDGTNLDMNRVYGTGNNRIKIDGGAGNIKVDFDN